MARKWHSSRARSEELFDPQFDLIAIGHQSSIAVGNRFAVLNRGQTLRIYGKGEIDLKELRNLMAGGKEPQDLSTELGGMVLRQV